MVADICWATLYIQCTLKNSCRMSEAYSLAAVAIVTVLGKFVHLSIGRRMVPCIT